MPLRTAPSQTIEDYLVTIYRLMAAGESVRGTDLAEQLGVSPAAVTEMVSRMRTAGLLGELRRIELSEEGLRLARTLVSRHRLAERFLVDVLGFGWEDVHEEAHRLEHAMSPAVASRLAAFLGNPTTCPHGHPIMPDGSAEPFVPLRPLSSLRRGQRGVVRRIAHEEHDLLASLKAQGVALGAHVAVRSENEGGMEVELEGRRLTLSPEAAAEVLVEEG